MRIWKQSRIKTRISQDGVVGERLNLIRLKSLQVKLIRTIIGMEGFMVHIVTREAAEGDGEAEDPTTRIFSRRRSIIQAQFLDSTFTDACLFKTLI